MRKASAVLLVLALASTGCSSPMEAVDPWGPGLPLKLSMDSDERARIPWISSKAVPRDVRTTGFRVWRRSSRERLP